MSDDELDREWTPNGRPQSTMARSFSLALNDLFKIDNSLADLDAAVHQKKWTVSSQTSELEALEARLRATEERLKLATGGAEGSSPKPRTPLGDTFGQSPSAAKAASPLGAEYSKPASRPVTASRPKTGEGQPSSPWRKGQLPPTPGGSEDGDIPPTEPQSGN